MNTITMALAKIPAKGIAFQPRKHAYTIHADDAPRTVYVESNTQGDELSAAYTFSMEWEIEDSEGDCFSDAFEGLLIAKLQTL